jgi:SOS-response transcriptional repressor LexA
MRDSLNPREIIERLLLAGTYGSQVALAKDLDISPQRITEAVSRGQIPELWIYRTAYKTGYRAEWLRTGRGAKLNPAHVSVAAESLADYGLPPSALVPVLTWVQAGALRSAVDLYPYAGAAEEYITVSLRGEHCFALRVRGDSMLPEFREGDMIVIDPDLSPRSGDFVVAVLDGTGEATFKRYQKKKDGEVLMPLNPDYMPIALQPEHRLVGKVIRLVRSY